MENVDASIVPTHCAADGPPSSTTLNIHHLELFYHVVRFGGITAAARQMPYGIQQSTISSQILLLEDTLGKQLFRRRPFELTAEGRVLFSYRTVFQRARYPRQSVARRCRYASQDRLPGNRAAPIT